MSHEFEIPVVHSVQMYKFYLVIMNIHCSNCYFHQIITMVRFSQRNKALKLLQ